MRNDGLNDSDVSIIKGIFNKYPEVESVYLFGSRAKGNFKKGSDIDLAIMNKLPNTSIINRIKDLFEDSSLPYLTDLIYYPEINHPELKDHITRVGIEFYRADK
jgi:predicted nucleotidyltransferase